MNEEPAVTEGDLDVRAVADSEALPSDSSSHAPDGFHSGFVALVGRPNVGKSTLLNALVGEHVAIVSRRPQTTRRRILGIRSDEATQAVFVDTPGIHRPRTGLGKFMVAEARQAIPEADIVVWVVDMSRDPAPTDQTTAGWVRDSGRPIVLAMNKSDLLRPEDVTKRTETFLALVSPVEWLLTIATQGHGLDRLWTSIAELLPEGEPLFPLDQLTDQTERMMVAELLRESALRHLGAEVPHGVAAVVDEWEERRNGVVYLACSLYVEREAHKAIVIGEGGDMIRHIGTRARRRIESLLERRVYLDVQVKVRESWRQHESDLRRMGYV